MNFELIYGFENVRDSFYIQRANSVQICAKTAENNIPVLYMIYISQYIFSRAP